MVTTMSLLAGLSLFWVSGFWVSGFVWVVGSWAYLEHPSDFFDDTCKHDPTIPTAKRYSVRLVALLVTLLVILLAVLLERASNPRQRRNPAANIPSSPQRPLQLSRERP